MGYMEPDSEYEKTKKVNFCLKNDEICNKI